ncbi:rhodanese-like domain-containing protein [Kitasatospora sp. NPDC056138]|uniref:rhodanese-like domain-containing protein n=1 Tax=Kitasatospora sp. NPDC056138 TaxID=3345724 RepID=UPI0035D963B4
MAREIDLDTFAAAWADGGLVLDVCQPEEYRAGRVPGALPVPAAKLPARAGAPAGRPVCVIRASGNRSPGSAGRMCARGVAAHPVAGGSWVGAGCPLATGSHPH